MKKFTKLFVLLIISLMAISCVTPGIGDFTEVMDIPDGKAVVYVYRPDDFSGWALVYDVKYQGEKVGTLHNKSYFYFFVEPGEHQITAKTETESIAYIEVEAGGSYYIRGTVKTGIMVGRPELMAVSSLQGRSEIVECNYKD